MSAPAWVMIDDDDSFCNAYQALDLPHDWEVVKGPRVGLAEIYNWCFGMFPNLWWYGMLADDVVPETKGWGALLVEAAGRDGLAYGDDGINGAAKATHFVVGGDLVREVGWLAFPGLQRLYIDTIWTELARAKGVLRYLPEVKITHHHFSNRMALMDAIYRKPNAEADRRLYEAWKATAVKEIT